MPYFPPQQTALDILNKLKTVDGSGSGLDADTIDGLHANELSTVAALNDLTDVTISTPSTNQVLLYNGSVWVNGTITSGVTDHGALTGLSDDDHSQYLLANGTRTGASSSRQVFTSGITTGSVRPSSDGSTALQFQSASGTTLASVNTTTNRWTFDRNEVQYDSGIVNVTMRPTLTTGYSTGFSTLLYYGTSMSYGGTTDSANTSYYAQVVTANAANVTWAVGWKSYIDVRNTSTLTNVASILIPDVNSVAAGATLTNVYGIYIASQTKGTNKYSIYTNAGDVRLMSSSSDKIGFHGVTPVARQTVPTGSSIDTVITALQNLGLFKQS